MQYDGELAIEGYGPFSRLAIEAIGSIDCSDVWFSLIGLCRQ